MPRKDCAEGLLEMEAEQLKEKLGKMNTYDLAALQATITLTSIDSWKVEHGIIWVRALTGDPVAQWVDWSI